MFAERLGYKRVAMNSDQERAMIALQRRVQKEVDCEMVLANSAKHDSQSNSIVAEAIQEVEGQARTIKLRTENRMQAVIPTNHPTIHWMVEYAAETINCFRVIKKKATPWELIRGKPRCEEWQNAARICCGCQRLGKVAESNS